MTDTLLLEIDRDSPENEDSEMVRAAQLCLADFKLLYLKWLGPVYRYFHYRVGNEKDAEDLTSQVFLKVYEELPRYRDRGHFSAWLFAIVRHKAADFFRANRPTISLEEIDPVDQSGNLLARAVQTDEIRRLQHLIRALPEREQELIRLRFVAGLSYREIGALLNRREDAVRKSTSRLLARLQNRLEQSHA
jgi:RNA polymerase sigma-70 factor (ECF subfamily)